MTKILSGYIGMDDTTDIDNAREEESGRQETSGHDVQKSGQADNLSEKPETGEKAADKSVLYPVQIAGQSNTVGNGSLQGLKPAVEMADKPAQKASLKEKLEAYKAQVAGTGKQSIEKVKGKEEML